MTEQSINPKSANSRTAALVCAIVLMFAGLAFGGHFLLDRVADRLIAAEAERTSFAWGEYVASQLDRVGAIADGAELTGEETEFLQGVIRYGDVFRFKLFDSQGRLQLVSDDLSRPTAPRVPDGQASRPGAYWKPGGRKPASTTVPESPTGRTSTLRPTFPSFVADEPWRSLKSMSIRPLTMPCCGRNSAALR